MNVRAMHSWSDANQRYLAAALAVVRNALERHVARVRGVPEGEERQALQEALAEAAQAMPAPATVTKLCAAFDLSPFERDMLLLCAGMELDGTFAALCAAAQGYSRDEGNGASYTRMPFPTFSLALAALPGAHWDALTPNAPLRRWRLITVGTGNVLTLSPLRIDEAILHYLAGAPHLDQRLEGIVTPLAVAAELVSSQRVLVERLVEAWCGAGRDGCLGDAGLAGGTTTEPMILRHPRLSIVQLCGVDVTGKQAIAAAACEKLGLKLSMLVADALPTTASELETFMRLWEREALLSESALLVDCDEMDAHDAAKTSALVRLMQRMNAPLLISCCERLRIPPRQSRPVVSLDVQKPSMSEQRSTWQGTLSGVNLNGHVEALVSQFNLSTSAIHAASAEVLTTNAVIRNQDSVPSITHDELGMQLWDACRIQARTGLEDLAQRIEPMADWNDLVLPEAQRQILHEAAAHVRRRTVVYEQWGVGNKGTRGLGISALFAGASGTGKTLAAEVLAHELRLDLYRIDLSSVVSKYIGETEKNLRRVFDAAEEGGAVLLFDEADALFGKRSEVKDSHDRYANIEVSYLLQRMETYRGLAILTTNLKSSLDTAFLRRIRFIVHFPFPDGEQRAEIWRRIFPPSMPTEGLDIHKLARLNVAGGNIRNIMLNAAFLAADANEPVRMTHLLRAASTEYAKLEKSLTEAEIGGWV